MSGRETVTPVLRGATRKGKSMTWFGVKCLFRMVAKGNASGESEEVVCEERVLLVSASTVHKAIGSAEKEAMQYAASNQWVNKDGRKVATTYIGACDAFRLSSAPGKNAEVYSKLFLIPRTTTSAAIADRFLGTNAEQMSHVNHGFEPDFERMMSIGKQAKRKSGLEAMTNPKVPRPKGKGRKKG